MDIFSTGEKQTLENILENKEWRSNIQNELMKKNADKTVVAVKLNIPGPIKNNKYIQKIFSIGLDELNKTIQYEYLSRNCGPEAFFISELSIIDAKKEMIKFEEESTFGRLFDVDVMSNVNEDRQYSRIQFGFSERKCFVCRRNAKECARSQRHSKKELSEAINDYYYKNIQGEI